MAEFGIGPSEKDLERQAKKAERGVEMRPQEKDAGAVAPCPAEGNYFERRYNFVPPLEGSDMSLEVISELPKGILPTTLHCPVLEALSKFARGEITEEQMVFNGQCLDPDRNCGYAIYIASRRQQALPAAAQE